jgi:hypothetical protein
MRGRVGHLCCVAGFAVLAASAPPLLNPVAVAATAPPCLTASGGTNPNSTDSNQHYTCYDDSAPRESSSESGIMSSAGGCSSGGDVGILAPHWRLVNGFPDPTTLEGQVTYSKVATDDTFWDHHTSDANFFVYPDASYRGLLADPGNFGTGEPNELGRIEVEWERGSFPSWALPAQGDWVHVEGAYIFDCGHPDFRTEMHPPRLVMTLRDAAKDTYAGAFGPRPGWASTLPGLGTLPVQTTRADLFASSDGGEAREQETCFGLTSCPFGLDWYQPLKDHNYHLFVPAPPKPAGNYSLIVNTVTQPLPFGMTRVTPAITPSSDPSKPGFNVDLDFTNFTEPGNHLYGVGTSIVVGWNKPATAALQRVRVVIDKYHVADPMDGTYTICYIVGCSTFFFNGDWSVSALVGDKFSYLLAPSQGMFVSTVCMPFNSGIQPGDYSLGQFSLVVGGGCPGVDGTNTFDVTLLPGQPLRVFVRAVEYESLAPNQDAGVVEHIFPDVNQAIGHSFTEKFQQHMSAGDDAMASFCPCGSVTYHVEDLPLPNPPATTLSLGTPSFAAGGASYVTGATAITITGQPPAGRPADTILVHERYFRDGTPAPADTTCASNPCVLHITANDGADGPYTVEYWSEDSTTGVIEGRQSASVTLDNTAPAIAITQPASSSYPHNGTLTLDYTVADGAGSGLQSFTPTLDGSPTLAGHGLQSGQSIDLLTELGLGPHTFRVDAVDNLGNTASASVTFTIVVTPDSIKDDVNKLAGSIKNQGLSNSLLSKLNAAATARAAGDCATAASLYQAFISDVTAQSGKGIDPAAGAILIADALYLISHCP